jgi:UDP-N-acetylmuramate dehydrogenase
MADGVLHHLEPFRDIVKPHEPLAPYTNLKLGGPAEALVQPRSREELAALLKLCSEKKIPVRILGGGCNILVRDEGVSGVVLRLSEPAFTRVDVEGKRIRTGGGASLAAVISQSARHGLAGLEWLVGIPGTVGGALRHNAGDRVADIGQFVRKAEVIEGRGQFHVRERVDVNFDYRASDLDDAIVIAVELELEPDAAEAIVKRMRKAWIQRKSKQPFSFQAAGRMFSNPRGLNVAALIEQAHLSGAKVGGAQVSERDANYVIAQPGATARDVLRLMDLIKSQVQEHFQVELEPDLSIW